MRRPQRAQCSPHLLKFHGIHKPFHSLKDDESDDLDKRASKVLAIAESTLGFPGGFYASPYGICPIIASCLFENSVKALESEEPVKEIKKLLWDGSRITEDVMV